MANELALADERNILDKHAEDIAELKRRARASAVPEAAADCCASYCCQDAPGEELALGETFIFCTFVPDPVGGQGLRLSVHGWVRYQSGGAGQVGIVINVRVNGTMYTGHPRNILTMANSDELTIPYSLDVDSPVADPTLTVEAQNIGATTFTIVQVHGHLDVGPEDGSVSCGVAGSG